MKKILLLVSCLLVVSCTAAYRPYKHRQGYLVIPLAENQFRIEYYSNNPIASKTNWHTAAQQLCGSEISIESEMTETFWRTVRTPVAGQMVDLGAQDFLYHGVVRCKGSVSSVIQTTPSQWRMFNAGGKKGDLVSDEYIARSLKILPARILGLSELPKMNASDYWAQHWSHKPLSQAVNGNRKLSLWALDGENGLPNHLVMIEESGCLESVYVLPPSIMLPGLVNADVSTLETLIKSGALKGYYFPQAECL